MVPADLVGGVTGNNRQLLFKKPFSSGIECINALDPVSFDKMIIGGMKRHIALPNGHGYLEMECMTP